MKREKKMKGEKKKKREREIGSSSSIIRNRIHTKFFE